MDLATIARRARAILDRSWSAPLGRKFQNGFPDLGCVLMERLVPKSSKMVFPIWDVYSWRPEGPSACTGPRPIEAPPAAALALGPTAWPNLGDRSAGGPAPSLTDPRNSRLPPKDLSVIGRPSAQLAAPPSAMGPAGFSPGLGSTAQRWLRLAAHLWASPTYLEAPLARKFDQDPPHLDLGSPACSKILLGSTWSRSI